MQSFSRINALIPTDQLASQSPDGVRDIILHTLLARIALCSGDTVEFQTKLDKASNTVELDFPDGILRLVW